MLAARALGLLSMAAGVLVTLRSDSRVWYGAVLVGAVLVIAPKSLSRRE